MSVTGHVFVNTPSLELIAQRISSFSGPMTKREDGTLTAIARSLIAMPNHGISVDARRYASVVLVHEGKDASEVADNTMIVFRLLAAKADVRILATLDLDATLATFEPGIRSEP